jgi:hypothetical protein
MDWDKLDQIRGDRAFRELNAEYISLWLAYMADEPEDRTGTVPVARPAVGNLLDAVRAVGELYAPELDWVEPRSHGEE